MYLSVFLLFVDSMHNYFDSFFFSLAAVALGRVFHYFQSKWEIEIYLQMLN